MLLLAVKNAVQKGNSSGMCLPLVDVSHAWLPCAIWHRPFSLPSPPHSRPTNRTFSCLRRTIWPRTVSGRPPQLTTLSKRCWLR